jgi:hypothetical protein
MQEINYFGEKKNGEELIVLNQSTESTKINKADPNFSLTFLTIVLGDFSALLV